MDSQCAWTKPDLRKTYEQKGMKFRVEEVGVCVWRGVGGVGVLLPQLMNFTKLNLKIVCFVAIFTPNTNIHVQ